MSSPVPSPALMDTPLWQKGQLVGGRYRIEGLIKQADDALIYRAVHLGWGWPVTLRRLWAIADEGEHIGGLEQSSLAAWCEMEAHPLLGACFGAHEIEGWRWLAAEFQAGAPLTQWLSAPSKPGLLERLEVAIQLAWALQTLHERDLHYGSLRPSAIYISAEGRPVLTHPIPTVAQASDWSEITTINTDPARLRAEDIWQWGMFLAELLGLDLASLLAQQPRRQHILLNIVGWLRSNPLERFTLEGAEASKRLQGLTVQLEQVYGLLFARGLRDVCDDISLASDLLHEAWEVLTGRMLPFSRPAPDPLRMAGQMAWNALEQGVAPEVSMRLWRELADAHPPRPEAAYNLSLLRYRKGEIGEKELRQSLDGISSGLETGDMDSLDVGYLRTLLEGEANGQFPATDRLERYFAASPAPCHYPFALLWSAPSSVQGGASPSNLTLLQGGIYRMRYQEATDRLVVGSESGALYSLSAQDGEQIALCEAHAGGVRDIAIQVNGSLVASCGSDGAIRLWNGNDLTLVREIIQGALPVISVAFSTDDALIAAADDAGTIQVWEVGSGAPRQALRGHRGPVNALVALAGGSRLLSAGTDRTLRVWDIESGECVREIKGHRNLISCISLSEDRKLALSGAWDRELRLWDLEKGECLEVFGGHKGWITSVEFSPCGNRAFSASNNGELFLWDLDSRKILKEERDAQGSWIRAIIIPSRCQTLFAAHNDGRISAASLTSPAERFRAPLILGSAAPWAEAAAPLKEFSLEGARAALRQGDVAVAYRHLRTHRSAEHRRKAPWTLSFWGNLYRYLPVVDYQGLMGRASFKISEQEITALACDSTGRLLCAGTQSGEIFIRDVYTEKTQSISSAHKDQVSSLAFSPDGKLLVSGSRDATLRIWDLAAGKLLRVIPHDSWVTSVGVVSDGKCVLSGSKDRYTRCWEVEGGKMCYQLDGHHRAVSSVAVSPDGRLLLSAGVEGSLKIWDRSSQAELRTLRGPLSENAACFTPDGRKVISGGYENAVHLWDMESGKLEREMFGHSERITAVAASPNSQFAFSVAADHTARIWSITRGECLQVLRTSNQIANCVVFDPHWRYLAAGTENGVVELWVIDWRLRRPSRPLPLLNENELRHGLFCPPVSGVRFTG